ncbi:MAG: KpsF/GutQ family sugar-phosphate isomerase [Planctomycetota bacterium]|nr:MAG: KpsF/GutQ family sugar-phosphate isomerase [Planctomycetota bacterium]
MQPKSALTAYQWIQVESTGGRSGAERMLFQRRFMEEEPVSALPNRVSEAHRTDAREAGQPLRSEDQPRLLPQHWQGRGREVIRQEAAALGALAAGIGDAFERAVQALLECPGKVIVTGIGKAGIVGRKLAASLSSTGTPSVFLHPAEAVHGDLGVVQSTDVVLVLSYSGETQEVNQLLPYLGECARHTIAITGGRSSSLGRAADIVLDVGQHPEAGELGLAPTTSTTLMMAMGDALAMVVSEAKGFSRQQFAVFHPAGSLGRQLAPVTDYMRSRAECRIARLGHSVREVLVAVSRPGRRTGCIMIVDEGGCLVGLFTDSDLARLLESADASALERPIGDVMTRSFHTVASSARMPEAIDILTRKKISELPVVDLQGRPVGILDVTDLVGVLAQPEEDEDDGPAILPLHGPH